MNRIRMGLLIWFMLLMLPRCGGETDGGLPPAGASGTGPPDSGQEDSSHDEEQADASSEENGELKAAQPQFSLPPGIYEGKQALALSTTTPSATILFTADGSIPVLSSAEYVVPIQLSEGTTTIKAIAVASGWLSSHVTAGVFIIKPIQKQQAAAPVFVPPSGAACTTSLDVSLSTPTAGTEIHYTTDGSDPGAASPLYAAPLVVSGKMTIRALAIDPTGTFLDSPISSASYACLAQAAGPTFAPPAGKYAGTQTVVIGSGTPGAVIYYTTDGTEPTEGSALYSWPIALETSTTLRALATAPGYSDSDVATAEYEIEPLPLAATPKLSPPPGNYVDCFLEVEPSTTTPGAQIRYTLNGIDPTESSALYTAPVVLHNPEYLLARAFAPGYSPSLVAGGHYWGVGECNSSPAPVVSPKGGPYCDFVTVTMSCGFGMVKYTLDGSQPSVSNGMDYSGPLLLTTTTTVRAVTIAAGFCHCATAVEVYEIVACPEP